MQTFRNLRERVESLPSRNPEISQAFFYKEIPSTNLDTMSRGRLAAPAGTLIVADSQSKGRGRLDRKWESPLGKGLYFSLLLRPDMKAAGAPLINLAVGLGIAKVLREAGVGKSMVKWPNDVTVEKKKLAGVLTEMVTKKDKVDFVVVGVGVNVLSDAQDFSPETAALATSLKQIEAKAWDRGEILENLVPAILHEVKQLVANGAPALISRWEKESGMVGERIRAKLQDREVEGEVTGLAADGQLKIKTAAGETLQLLAEDATLI